MSVRVILKQEVHGWLGEHHYTPDFLTLQAKYDYLPVFLYGCEQLAYSDSTILRHHPRLGIGFFPSAQYTMYKTKECSPFVLFNGEDGQGTVRGEVYLLPPVVISNLDMYHTNGVFMRRSMRLVHWYKDEDKEKKDRQWFATECFSWLGITARMNFLIKNKSASEMVPITGKDGTRYFHWRKGDDQPNRLNNHKAL